MHVRLKIYFGIAHNTFLFTSLDFSDLREVTMFYKPVWPITLRFLVVIFASGPALSMDEPTDETSATSISRLTLRTARENYDHNRRAASIKDLQPKHALDEERRRRSYRIDPLRVNNWSEADNNFDPGVRDKNYGTGAAIDGLSKYDQEIFATGFQRFQEVEATSEEFQDFPVGVPAPVGKTNSAGLSGRFNSNQCSSCHAHPTIGGSSPALNPLFDVAAARGAKNEIPFFMFMDGPIREVRQVYDEDGFRHGGVINLFTLKGRYDAPLCDLEQPNFEAHYLKNNLAFRIPTPVFGLGLVESIPDQEILHHMRSNREEKAKLGIMGRPNRSAHTKTISRFGWKAQNESLMIFSGEAYNVEMGISNELFPTSRSEELGSIFGEPFDVMRTEEEGAFTPTQVHASWVLFAMYMRFLAPPVPAPSTKITKEGEAVFKEIGCVHCHVPSMNTFSTERGGSRIASHAGRRVNLYSDLLIHKMGAQLADNISQGDAGPDDFRTAPLWGLGQRIFFLHDGRTSDLETAIVEHYSDATEIYPASEANAVVEKYIKLPDHKKHALMQMLRSL